jgi:hypothetical protein
MNRPRVIVVGGVPGSGKSTAIAALRRRFPGSMSVDLADTEDHRLVMRLREARLGHWRDPAVEHAAARRLAESIALAKAFRRGFAPAGCRELFVELVSPVDVLADLGDVRVRLVPPPGVVEEQLMRRGELSGASAAWLHTVHTLCARAVPVPAGVQIAHDAAQAVAWVESQLAVGEPCFA